ncbi:MAG: Mpo1 family 2-hydroxy fatty acid dioxygenase [Pseudobdellovibrio sp.]
MRTLDSYLSEYAESHQHPLNVQLHNICVPAIMWSLLGFLSTFKVSSEFNAGILFAIVSLIFYALLRNLKVFVVLTLVVVLCFLTFQLVPALRLTSTVVFILAWLGQFYGHKIEGKKPSFFKDLLFLLVGPVWVLKKFKLL